MRRMAGKEPVELRAVATAVDVFAARGEIGALYLDEKLEEYIVDIVQATREPAAYGLADLAPLIEYGASPRASIHLATGARAHAYLRGRAYVLPDDVKAIGHEVLRHRVITSFEAEAEEVTSDDIVDRIFAAIDVP
jgi:MoxR-like ATPase